MPVPSGAARLWSEPERRGALAQGVALQVGEGCRIESQSDFQAVVVKGSKPNHLLHLILTLVTLGAWAFVWIP